MEGYSINQTAQALGRSKDTLRYYDKIGLVKPDRDTNRYRVYTDEDVLALQYIEVMKFAGLSLQEIGTVLRNRIGQSEANRQSTLAILASHRVILKRKIRLYQALEQMVLQAVQTVEAKDCLSHMGPVDDMVRKLYLSIGKDGNDEK